MLVKTYFLCLRRNKFHCVQNCREKFKFENSISHLVILVSVISGEFFRSESEPSFGDRTKGQNTAVQEVQKNNQCQALSKHLKILFLFSVSMLTVDCPRGGLLRMVTTPALPWMDIRWALCSALLSQSWIFLRKRVLFSKTPSGGNPSSTSQGVTMMWRVRGEEKYYGKKNMQRKLFRSMSRASSLSSEFGHTEVSSRIFVHRK